MKQGKLFHLLFVVIYILLKMYGFLPITFDFKTNRFNRSQPWLCYSVAVMLAYCLCMAFVYLHIARIVHHDTSSLHAVFMRFQFFLNYCFFMVTICVAIVSRENLRKSLNSLILLSEVTKRKCQIQKDFKLLKRYSRKVLLVDFLFKIVICWSFYLYGQHGLISALFSLNFFFMWSLTIFASGFTALCYFVAHLYRLINLRVDGAIQQLSDFETDKGYWQLFPVKKQFVCLHVANELNKLANLHRDVTYVVKKIAHIIDWPLLLNFIWYFLIVTFGIFYAYTSLVKDIRNNLRPALMRYGHSFGYAIFQALQFYYIVSSAALMAKRAEKTGVLLNRGYKANVEERVERTISMFSIELLHESFAIENFGMFKIDYMLLYSVVGTIATYLIVMIQFQLSQ